MISGRILDADIPAAQSREEQLRLAVEHAAHLLPQQGPIGVFVHHNTLHAFEHLPFEKAVIEAAHLFGAEPYMSEAAYRAELARGRIQLVDIDAALDGEPDALVFARLSRGSGARRQGHRAHHRALHRYPLAGCAPAPARPDRPLRSCTALLRI